MASISFSGESLISLLTLFSLLFLTHATLHLHPSDYDALLLVQKHLGINGQRRSSPNPCNTPGVFCERRVSDNATVLRVTRLVFKSQRLSGFLSPQIGRLSQLKELSLPDNYLLDRIPSQIVDCRKLEILELRNNQFSGEIPPELSSLVRLRILDLSSNKFSGNLNFLRFFPNLEKLSLAENLFSGKVPVSVRSFRNLRVFNLSGNSFLEGPVPGMREVEVESIASALPRRYVFAENLTRGSSNHSAVAPSGSSGYYGEAPAPSPSAPPHTHRKNKKLSAWILGFIAGAVAGCISGLVFSVLFKALLVLVRGGGKESGPAIFSPLIKKAEDLAFLEKDDGMASLEIIGKGGCGEVYRAELPGGKLIAIKKIVQPPKDAAELAEEDSKLLNKKMRQIRSEIQTVGNIRHRNLLPLLAHVSRPNCHYLVYEGTRELDWLARHRVALGVAAGLEYLHMSHSPRIIHRDLKPGNILLDDDMEARIADFGLAKAVPDANTHVTTSNVAGTVGYIAPEYHQTLKFTDKCDIYSFGVLLGVLVVGKLPSDDFFQHTAEMSLVKWMANIRTSDDPSRAIDRKLMGNGFEEQMLLVLKIACFCTVDDAKIRPNSKDVRMMLSQIKH
ncbi:hypothetical protein AAG906_026740 [Vitis piasezkii]